MCVKELGRLVKEYQDFVFRRIAGKTRMHYLLVYLIRHTFVYRDLYVSTDKTVAQVSQRMYEADQLPVSHFC